MDQVDVLRRVCDALMHDDRLGATDVLNREFPFRPPPPPRVKRRNYTKVELTDLFVRDGFTDRYTGARLMYPPALRLISEALPKAFPYQSNWKMTETHIAYWRVSATLDHVFPLALGGEDAVGNWVTCSMLTNSAKSDWTLDQLAWELHKPGDFARWDGLLHWFVEYIGSHSQCARHKSYRSWYRAAQPYAL